MTRALYITNNTHRRRICLLRTNHLTLTKLSMWQKLMTPTKCRAYRPNTGKADPAPGPTAPAQQIRQFGSKANQSLKSP